MRTEVQRLSFVCSTSEVGYLYPLWNIQNLGAVPPYCGSRRFSVVWCETSRYRLKVYYSFCLLDDQEVIFDYDS